MLTLLAAAHAGRYALDDNPVGWRWRTVSTRTAEVHYPVSRWGPPVDASPVAARVAQEVDGLWEAVCARTGHEPTGPLHIVVLEHTDQLEGFTLPADDWVVFSGHPGPDLARMRGRADWVPDLLAHELAHVATDAVQSVLPKSLRGLGLELGGVLDTEGTQLGGGFTLRDADPYWFSEGVAELVSEQAGVNRWTPERAATLRASVLDDRLLESERWGNRGLLDDWYDPERAYQEGYAFLRWLESDQGEGTVRALLEASGRRVRARWEDVFVECTGESIHELLGRFRQELRAEVDGFVRDRRRQGLAEGRELSTWDLAWQRRDLRDQDRWHLREQREREERRERTGTWNLHPAWSADGRWFGRNRGGWLEVRWLDEDLFTVFAGEVPDWDRTEGQRDRSWDASVWLPSVRGTGFAFVPGRDAVVLTQEVGETGGTPLQRAWNQLVVVDLTVEAGPRGPRLPDGEGTWRRRTRVLPDTLRGFDPDVGADGTVVFSRYEGGSANLWVTDLDGGGARALTTFTDGTWVEGASLSPDGTRVVASVHRRDRQDLWIFDLDGGVELLTRSDLQERDPHWADDGSIWFVADLDGVPDVFRRSEEGVVRQTRVLTAAATPRISPDGDLVYSRFSGFGWKTHGLPLTELLWEPVQWPEEGEVSVESVPTVADRRYRPLRALLTPAFSPSFRLDRGLDGTWAPRVGLFVRLRDAVEHHTLSGQVLAGRDVHLRGRYVWHGLWPDLGVSASETRTRLPDEGDVRLGTWSVDADLPVRPGVSVSLSVGGYRYLSETLPEGHDTRSLVVGFTGTTGGLDAQLLGTLADSDRPWARLETYLEGDHRAPFAPDADHRVRWELAGGLTDRSVALPDQLRIGGDHPYAFRRGQVQATVGLPGYGPYAFAADRFGKGGLALQVPLARRLGQVWGNGVVDRLDLELGGHLALVQQGRLVPVPLADLVGRVRVGMDLLGRRADSSFAVAWGAPAAGQGGFRTILALGSAW